MFNQTLHHYRKYICWYCFQSFGTAQTLERHFKGKQMIKMAGKGETVKFKNYARKIKLPFMIYADFESILIPENKAKYQNHIGCSFGYRLMYVDDQFSKPFRLYLGQDAVRKFIINIVL